MQDDAVWKLKPNSDIGLISDHMLWTTPWHKPNVSLVLTEPVVLILHQVSNNNLCLLSYVHRNKNYNHMGCNIASMEHNEKIVLSSYIM
jgi:hypothetical protein